MYKIFDYGKRFDLYIKKYSKKFNYIDIIQFNYLNDFD